MTAAFREGWERIFGPPPPEMLNCPFNLRHGMVIGLELPSDLKLREVRGLPGRLGSRGQKENVGVLRRRHPRANSASARAYTLVFRLSLIDSREPEAIQDERLRGPTRNQGVLRAAT
jgi:hypothetical protein